MNTSLPITVIVLVPSLNQIEWAHLEQLTWAGEILIVLTTEGKSAKRADLHMHSVKIIQSKPIEDFAQVRNDAMKRAKHNWIFFLDSDEWLAEHATSDIEPMLEDESVAWSFPRTDYFLGHPIKYGEPGRSRVTRLFHKEKTHYAGKVHEVPELSGVIARSSLVINHHAHQSIAGFWNKISWYAQLAAQEKSSTLNTTIFQLIVFPPLKWLVGFVLWRGFLDGWRGLVYATLMSCHSLLVRLYRIEIILSQRQSTNKDS